MVPWAAGDSGQLLPCWEAVVIHTPPCRAEMSFEFQWKRVLWGLLLQPQTKGWKIPKLLTFEMLQATYKVSVQG